MNETLLAAVVGLLVAGLGGLLVPALISSVPEPAPKEAEPEPEHAPEEDRPLAEPAAEEPPKMLYADIATHRGLRWRSVLACAVAGGLIGAATGLDWSLVWLLPLTPVAVALAVIDWHTKLLPRRIVVPATLAAIVAVVVVGLATDERDALVRALVAMLVVRTFFWVLWFVRSAGMGFGDVRLAALVGLVLGWVGWGAVAIGLWSSFLLFAVPALVVLLARRDRTLLKRSFPFGPFMVLGTLVGLVWGTPLAELMWG
ncbi:A24 family peptidase [Nocardioides KLBMP 9356]|uniref:A24 family peptidase n=1 Tax=Nocardioides potassii TaxID=2911371 RepID=A0ABS9HAH2_9ACTN|nr:A24 family peptidase [Nocardioides potassii]MCF6377444.1 A24 family peptidase [Nocardioides potassii]